MDDYKVREDYQYGSSTTGNGSVDLVSKPLQEVADQSSSGEDTFLSPDSFSSSGRRHPENIHISDDNSPKLGNVSPKARNISPKAGHASPKARNASPKAGHASPKAGNVSPKVGKDDANKQVDKTDVKAGHVDTAAPFESVKEAVSKFGVIVDWKAHRVQTTERRKYIEQELEKAREEIPVFKQKAEAAEKAKDQALRELDGTKRLIQELKLNLERAQTEERQAKQDSELAQLRVTEMEQGVTDESSVAAKTQLEVAKARHQAAASELVTAKTDLEEIRRDLAVLESERDSAVQKAKEAVSAAKEIERNVEDLTIQLITTKESIESTHASHLEAEEHRFADANARDQDALNWEKNLKDSEDELERVKTQIIFAKDLRAKLETASVLLQKLKGELAAYMQGQSESNDNFTRVDIHSGVALAKKNLNEVHENIEKAQEEIECLKSASGSLTADLESEKAVLTKIRKQKGLGAEAVTSLESELKQTRTELDDIRKKEKEARDKLSQLPKQLEKVTAEAEKAKSLSESARKLLKKAKEVADQTKSEGNAMSTRLAAAQKEIEAARAAEKLALGAISALQESDSAHAVKKEDPTGGVTISLEEYYELTTRGHDAEEAANKRVEDAMAQIDEAKDSEMQSLNKLTQLNSELAARKEALNVALQKAELAKESKMNVEEELKKRKGEKSGKGEKGENEEKRKPAGRGLGLFHGLRENLTKESVVKNLKENEKKPTKENEKKETPSTSVGVAASLKLRFGKKATEVKNKDKDKDGSVKGSEGGDPVVDHPDSKKEAPSSNPTGFNFGWSALQKRKESKSNKDNNDKDSNDKDNKDKDNNDKDNKDNNDKDNKDNKDNTGFNFGWSALQKRKENKSNKDNNDKDNNDKDNKDKDNNDKDNKDKDNNDKDNKDNNDKDNKDNKDNTGFNFGWSALQKRKENKSNKDNNDKDNNDKDNKDKDNNDKDNKDKDNNEKDNKDNTGFNFGWSALQKRKEGKSNKDNKDNKDKDKDNNDKDNKDKDHNNKDNKDKDNNDKDNNDNDKDIDGDTSPDGSKGGKKKKKQFGMPKFFMFMPNKKNPQKNP